MGAIEQPPPSIVQLRGLHDLYRQRRFAMSQNKNGAKSNRDGFGEAMAHLRFEGSQWRIGWPVAQRQVGWQADGVPGVVLLAPALNLRAQWARYDRNDHPSARR
jgi:hypothetical protein